MSPRWRAPGEDKTKEEAVIQYSIRNLSEATLHPDYRWDGEYLHFEPYKNSKPKYVSIGNVLSPSQYGISIEMNEEGNGTKI